MKKQLSKLGECFKIFFIFFLTIMHGLCIPCLFPVSSMLLTIATSFFFFCSRPPPGPSTPSKLVSFAQRLKAFLFALVCEQNVLSTSLIHH